MEDGEGWLQKKDGRGKKPRSEEPGEQKVMS